MSIDQTLLERAENACELCKSSDDLVTYAVAPQDDEIVICAACDTQIESGTLNSDHWQALSETMWSPVPAVQAMIWRLLTALQNESWASDLRDMLYLEQDVKTWVEAESFTAANTSQQTTPTKDSNGTILQAGDNITLIKDLAVKGAGFTAKRGTMVRNISLTDNPEHIEGRVNGQQIVLVSAYLKKVV